MTDAPPPGPVPGLDRLLSDPTRLTIMAVLGEVDWCDFTFLRDQVALSDSALSKQLTTLKTDGQIEQKRTYLGRVPKTTVRATDAGRRRFLDHVDALRAIAERTRDRTAKG
jgi:DNA-binding transcriptional ArsR family regulator